MNRLSLNTAIMSFAFSGMLAPHRYADEDHGAGREDCGPAPARSFDVLAAWSPRGEGSRWMGATTGDDGR
jgi:hypothetical protein